MKFSRTLVFILFGISVLSAQDISLLKYVDPMIGTGAHGHTFPGATVPFGMIQLSPTNDFKGWDWCSGYHYSDTVIKGFAHNHLSGTGLAGLGDILLMATEGEVKLNAGDENIPGSGYRSRFSHEREIASPGYYKVVLDDYKITAELTCTERVGVHRYTFPASGNSNIIIDPTNGIAENIFETSVKIISDTEIQGYKHCSGEGGRRHVYFAAKFSKPFKNCGAGINGVLNEGLKEITDSRVQAFAQFDTKDNESIEVKVAISFVSQEGAVKNLNTLPADFDFDDVHKTAVSKWENVLNKIEIDGPEKVKRIFYSGMYHAFIAPNLYSDADGWHPVEGSMFRSDIPQYSTYSTWDTFRALHPLFTIIEPGKNVEIINSLISRYSLSKVGLPVWELIGHDNVCMIGHNTVPVISDGIIKKLPGINLESALDAMIHASNNINKSSPNYGNNGLNQYLSLGYVAGGSSQSVSLTMEYAYYDWCIYNTAKFLGNEKIAEEYLQRSKAYINLFNNGENYFWPKDIRGEWMKVDWSEWDDLISHYVSGNVWGYSTFLPHAVPHLIKMHGGKGKFIDWLDSIVSDTTQIGGGQHVDISGFIGKYGHGDEPSQQFPFLYSYAGEPYKTQKIVRQVMNQFYNDTPEGLINNEDCGQMSAWYILNALGFYPVCPGDLKYTFGSPIVRSAVINLPDGKKFNITTENNSDENIYIQKVLLNDEPLSRSYIYHKEITEGGKLIFIMGPVPNKDWAGRPEDCPDFKEENKIYESEPFSFTTLPVFEKESADVFADRYSVKLYCNTPAADIRYTLDGTEPGESSELYKNEIIISNETLLKAKAFSSGKPPSITYEKKYFKSMIPTCPDIKILSIKNKPANYGNEDGTSLIDGRIGTTAFSHGGWSGWPGSDLDVIIDLGVIKEISEVSVGILTATGSWIFSPKSIVIEGGTDADDLNELGSKSFELLNHEFGPDVTRHKFEFNKQNIRYLRIFVENTGIIPDWHGGRNQNAWLFVDEVLIN